MARFALFAGPEERLRDAGFCEYGEKGRDDFRGGDGRRNGVVVHQRQLFIALFGVGAEGVHDLFWEGRDEDRFGQVVEGFGELRAIEVVDAVHEDAVSFWQEDCLGEGGSGMDVFVRDVLEDVVEDALLVVVG